MGGRNLGLLLFVGAAFGASFLFMRVAAPVVGPWIVAGSRVAIAALLLAIVLRGRGLDVIRARWRVFLILGLVNTAVPLSLFGVAATTIPASMSAIVNAATPLSTAIVGAVWLGHRLTARTLLAIGLGIAGVTVLIGWSPVDPTPPVLLAVGAVLLATVCYGFGLTYARRAFGRHVDPTLVAAGQLGVAALVLAPLTIGSLPAAVPPVEVLAALTGLAIVSTALAWPVMFRLLASVGPTATSTVTFLAPAFGVFWGALLLGEPIGLGTLVGAALIGSSLILILDLAPWRRLRAAAPFG